MRQQEAITQKLQNEKTFQKYKSRFVDIQFADDLIEVCVLKNIAEYQQEGENMHHCVFTNNYFERKNSLILSARIGEKRIETIEFSLKTFEVIQSMGQCNLPTEHHDRIVQLVENNAHRFRGKRIA